MEYMINGDLRTYLLSRRHQATSPEAPESFRVRPQAITTMALEVALALQYLFEHLCVHRCVFVSFSFVLTLIDFLHFVVYSLNIWLVDVWLLAWHYISSRSSQPTINFHSIPPHRDLACRNCLVSGTGTVKISDFGFAKKLAKGHSSLVIS